MASETATSADLAATAEELRSVIARLNRRLRQESGMREFTPSQVDVVRRLLADGPATTSALARAEGMRPQSMAAIVAGIEQAGYVARRPDPADGRASVVYVTEQGERDIRASRAAKEGWLVRTMAERLTDAEQRRLADAAALLARLLET